MAYDTKAFNEALNENMADDPYGTAVFLIVEALKGATTYHMTMNEREYHLFVRVAMLLDEADPNIHAFRGMNEEFQK